MANQNSSEAAGNRDRRGRPAITAEKRVEMRGRIAEEAKRLFHAEGYRQVSMRRIAKEVGCAPMTLYKYYPAKIEILRTLWDDVFNEIFDHLDSIKDISGAPEERLRAISVAYVSYWIEHQDKYRLVFLADGVTQPDVSIFVDDSATAARFTIFAAAISAVYDDELTPEDLKSKLDATICFLHGIAHNKVTISGYPWSSVDDLVALAIRR